MFQEERLLIISSLKVVDKVYMSVDKDKSVEKTIKLIHNELNDNLDLFFANGGDQTNESVLERQICEALGVVLIDNLGDKVQSSSWLLNKGK